MAKSIFCIGVDGGGTKTAVCIQTLEGELLGKAYSGPANIGLSVTQAWNSINEAISSILKPLGLSLNQTQHQFYACMGLAGNEYASKLQAFLASPHLFTKLQVVSDAYIACQGAHDFKSGAIIIAGTGVIGYRISYQGNSEEVHRVSGWGFPHDDAGGGAWLGWEAIKLTIQTLDQRRLSCDLTEQIFKIFNYQAHKLIEFANTANSTEFGKLAPYVIQAAQNKVVAALDVMHRGARYIEDIWRCMQTAPAASESQDQANIGHLSSPAKDEKNLMNLPCALLGGLAPHLKPYLSTLMQNNLVEPQYSAEDAAVMWLRRYLNF